MKERDRRTDNDKEKKKQEIEKEGKEKKQEAFREQRHLRVCDLWPWVVTLTISQGQKGLCH